MGSSDYNSNTSLKRTTSNALLGVLIASLSINIGSFLVRTLSYVIMRVLKKIKQLRAKKKTVAIRKEVKKENVTMINEDVPVKNEIS